MKSLIATILFFVGPIQQAFADSVPEISAAEDSLSPEEFLERFESSLNRLETKSLVLRIYATLAVCSSVFAAGGVCTLHPTQLLPLFRYFSDPLVGIPIGISAALLLGAPLYYVRSIGRAERDWTKIKNEIESQLKASSSLTELDSRKRDLYSSEWYELAQSRNFDFAFQAATEVFYKKNCSRLLSTL